MDTINNNSKNLEYMYGDQYAQLYHTSAIKLFNHCENKPLCEDLMTLITTQELTCDDDSKQRQISALRSTLSTTVNQLDTLKKENIDLKNNIIECKNDISELKSTVDLLIKDKYLITICQAYENIQVHIIKTVLGINDDQFDEHFDDHFSYNKYKKTCSEDTLNLILFEEKKYNILSFSKVMQTHKHSRNSIAHPCPVDLNILKKACIVYSDLSQLYNTYCATLN